MRFTIFQQFLYWFKTRLLRLYAFFIASYQTDISTRNRAVVLHMLLIGTCVAFLLLFAQLVIGYLFFDIQNALQNAMIALLVCFLAIATLFISKRKSYIVAASILTAVYILLAFLLLLQFGNGLPFALMLLCLVIVLAGILLGSRFALYATLFAISMLFITETLDTLGLYSPDESWITESVNYGETIGYSIVLLVIGTVSWLFGRQTERSFADALRAEEALRKERALLEETVKKRTLELQVVQFEEMQQLYRFAEVGQLSAALLHDLANHLSILTLDIEGLQQKQRSESLDRARRSILYLDDMVERVRLQLHDESEAQLFNIVSKLNEVVRLLRPRAAETGVVIAWASPGRKQDYLYLGDSVKFNQIIAIVINNAIEAYSERSSKQPTVFLELHHSKHNYEIIVKDYGKGIPMSDRKKLFEPFRSTKKKGMGIGLFIARRMLEKYFKGTIELAPTTNVTQFTITIPRKNVDKP